MFSKIFDRTIFPMSALIFSNAPALIAMLWLVPEIAYLEVLIWMWFALVSLWALNRHGILPLFMEKLRTLWIVLPFVIFSLVSVAWSAHAGVTVSRWFTFIFIFIVGGYLGVRNDVKKLLEYLTVFCGLMLVASVAFVYLLPDQGVMHYYSIQGAWKGIYWHKNHMGFIAGFAAVLFLVNLIQAWTANKKQALAWAGLYIFSLAVLYMTDSVGAYLSVIVLHGIVLLVVLLLKFGHRLRARHYVIFGAVVAVGALAIFFNLDFVFSLFNRSTSLTGRIPMWGHLFDVYLSQHPLEGYGFNAFWKVLEHRVTIQMLSKYPDQIIIADNGFVDILMNVGIVGLFFFLLFYFVAWWRAVKYSITTVDIAGTFPVIFMAYTLIANVSWSLFFESESFFMLAMIALLFAVTGKKTQNLN